MKRRSNMVANAVKMALLATTSASFAVSATAVEQDSAKDEQAQETFVIVGSRIKRVELETASPVTLITAEDMKEQGHTTVFDALKSLTMNNGTQAEGPEFANNFTPDIQTLNIRGFGVGNTLTLINGRRVANYPAAYQGQSSAVNFGAIPQAAVERIEVLSGGGSSIYGSDAVAGVINIVLKDNLDSTTLNVLYGRPVEANANDYRVDLTTGWNFDKGNITLGLSHRETDPVRAGDYDQFDSNFDYPYSEITPATLTLDTYVRDWNNNGLLVDPGQRCEEFGATRYQADEDLGYACGRDAVASINFRNQKEQSSVFLNGYYEVGDVELFAEFLYNSSESTVARDTVAIEGDIETASSSYTIYRSFYETDLQRSFDSYFEDESINYSIGARGFIGDHEWELSGYRSEYTLDSRRTMFKTQEVMDVFFGNFLYYAGGWPVFDGSGSFGLADNPFALIDDTNRDLVNSTLGTQYYGNKTSSTGGQLLLNGSLFEMPAGPVFYAAVLEYEEQELEFIPDELILQQPPFPYTTGSGWLGLTGYDGRGDRERSAIALEANLPVSETLNINLAARADRYDQWSSSIGTRVTPSIKFEYRPIEDILMRGGYSESYRAPDLVQVYGRTGFYTNVVDYYSCWQGLGSPTDGSFNPQQDCLQTEIFARQLGPNEVGYEPLKDETGDTRWLGFVYDITEELSIQVDWQEITLEDKATALSTDQLLKRDFVCRSDLDLSDITDTVSSLSCGQVSNLVSREFNSQTGTDEISQLNVTPLNISTEAVETIDARVNYNLATGYGRFDVRVDYSHLLSHTFDGIELRDNPLVGGAEPRSNVNATIAWGYEDFSTAVTMIRRGSTVVFNPFDPAVTNGEITNRVKPYFQYNLTTAYNWTPEFSTRLTVRNLLDNEAPKDRTIGPQQFPWYNTSVYGGSGIGREVYLEMNYTF